MKVDARPRRTNKPRPAWKIAGAYLQWLRGRKCAVANADCGGRIEAAHTPDPNSKGAGTKAADYNAIPLCAVHHHQQHTIGWQSFAKRHRVKDINDWRQSYWRAWPGWAEWKRDHER